MILKTFPKGGVHPPENKMASNAAIKVLPLPSEVRIPVVQHLGAPADLPRNNNLLDGNCGKK